MIEIKSSSRIDPSEVAHLARNISDIPQITDRYYISQDTSEVEIHGVKCMSWIRFLDEVFINPS